MIQDIAPYTFHNEYTPRKPVEDDYALCYCENEALLIRVGDTYRLPTFKDIMKGHPEYMEQSEYLFSIDTYGFFLIPEFEIDKNSDFVYETLQSFRTLQPRWQAFAGITGSQLYRFKLSHQFCGCCGGGMHMSTKERAYVCVQCNHIDYPKISPAVIVGVIDGDRILMSQYAHGSYKHYALLAGFAEFGESIEDTVRREVMEEVGVKVKNIRYYKSQPWSFTDTLLLGFFADLDGSPKITLEEDELKMADWFERDQIPETKSNESLTNEMIELFRNKKC